VSFANPVTGVTWRPCEFCGELLDPESRYTWYRVIGWSRPGAAGGSDIMLRERHGQEFAHDHCVRLTKSRLAVGQGTLL
jgi:hypothetical protein